MPTNTITLTELYFVPTDGYNVFNDNKQLLNPTELLAKKPEFFTEPVTNELLGSKKKKEGFKFLTTIEDATLYANDLNAIDPKRKHLITKLQIPATGYDQTSGKLEERTINGHKMKVWIGNPENLKIEEVLIYPTYKGTTYDTSYYFNRFTSWSFKPKDPIALQKPILTELTKALEPAPIPPNEASAVKLTKSNFGTGTDVSGTTAEDKSIVLSKIPSAENALLARLKTAGLSAKDNLYSFATQAKHNPKIVALSLISLFPFVPFQKGINLLATQFPKIIPHVSSTSLPFLTNVFIAGGSFLLGLAILHAVKKWQARSSVPPKQSLDEKATSQERYTRKLTERVTKLNELLEASATTIDPSLKELMEQHGKAAGEHTFNDQGKLEAKARFSKTKVLRYGIKALESLEQDPKGVKYDEKITQYKKKKCL